MGNIPLEKVSLEEVVNYSKQKESPVIILLDSITDDEFEEIGELICRLKLLFLCVTENRIAFINNKDVALKIAKDFHKKSQVMYYDFAQRPSGSLITYALTGYTKSWITLRDNGYIVKAYDEEGQEMQQPWLNTDIEEVTPSNLNKLGLKNFEISLGIRGINSSGNSNKAILELSRHHFIHDGIYNAERNCYYPRDRTTARGTAEYNKLEKLFRKWGFQKFH